MGFWRTAEVAATVEFGRRHYRGIIAWKVARILTGPALLAASVGLLALTAVRYVWPALRHGAPAAWHPSVNAVPALVIAVTCLVAVSVAIIAWRRWGWRVEIRAPWLTGRVISVLGGLLLVAAMMGAAWPR